MRASRRGDSSATRSSGRSRGVSGASQRGKARGQSSGTRAAKERSSYQGYPSTGSSGQRQPGQQSAQYRVQPSMQYQAQTPVQPRGARRSSGSYQPAPQKSGTKIGIIIGVVLAFVIALVVAYVALSHSSLLRIERIEATGVEHLTADEIEQLADVPDDASLLNVDEALIRDNLLQDAWIKDVQVKRILPNTLRLEVTERGIAAVVSIPSSSAKTTKRWAISEDGIWLMPIPEQNSEAGKTTSSKVYEDAASALQITDVPYGEQPTIGTKSTNQYVNCALDVVTGLTTSLKDQIASVKASDVQSVTLILDNNVEIVFGNAEDIREKERICLELLERYPDQISYINVRSVENPTWRSI